MSSKKKTTDTKDDGKPTLVPKLRFPEFREAGRWEERAGDSLFEQINDQNTESGLPVLAITQEHGAIPRHMIDYHVSVSDRSIQSYKVVRVGDFIISLRSFQGGIEYSRYHGICSPAYVILRLRGEGSHDYFRHYLKTDRFIRILTKNLEGLRDGKMISYSQFSELLLAAPCPTEQQKIAKCLSSVDEVIEAQARKVDALKTYKKGLMHQLFPREGDTQPRLRFPEFRHAGEWVSQLVGDIGQVITGSTPGTAQSKFYGGGIPLVSPADISDLRFVNQTKTTLTTEGFEKTRPIRARSVLFVCIGSTIGKVAQNVRDCATNQQINAVVPNSKHSDDFVYFALSNASERIALLAGKQAIPIIKKSLFSSVKLLVPELPEQQRIASCLSCLDALITTETKKLDVVKLHKRGLMQQLFPSPEEVEA
ncbi:restriction endonuclease subunit S [Myxococcota bacterium]|nr:restriction endonuclease subunit S [Myxococcota bacterium]